VDELEKAILAQLGSQKKKTISDIEDSGLAARQTIHTRVEDLVRQGYIQEERETKLPFRRYLSLAEKGLDVLEFEVSRDRGEIEERAEGERGRVDAYRTSWLFRDFVHRDLSPRESVIGGALRIAGTLGIVQAYRDVFQPAFMPSENERDYAELLMRLLVDSVDYDGLFEEDGRLKELVRIYPPYKKTIAKGTWTVTTGFRGPHFDYLAAFGEAEVQKLAKRPFVGMLEKNYLESLNEECSSAVGEGRVRLDRDSFLKVLCWMRLKERSLSLRAYDGLREALLVVALSDLGLTGKG
jgi:hypothetical protein